MTRNSADIDDLPEPLGADLRRMYRAEIEPSPAVDQAILNRARAHFAGRKRTLLLRRVAGAAAAVILITAAVIPTMRRTQPPRPPVARQLIHDVNADSTVDIRDALALQRSIDAGGAGGAGGVAGRDVNGDGAIDRRDVDAIAMLAVRLDARDKGATR